ncbi:MAG TPA: transglycosylase domain-containing protein [Candidatus Saccharimonadales bacterium]|jgi:penicillin-binding protein 1A
MGQNTGRNRRGRSTYTTKSGKAIKLNQSISDRKKAKKAERAAARALYLSTLPKNKWKRILVRFEPKRLYKYWFSRQGAIMGLKVIGVGVLLCFFLTIGLFAYFRKDLPQLKDISGDSLGGSVSYYDSTGKVLLFQDYDGVKRVPVASNQISPYMKDATVAIEDKNFYKEGAFDVRSIFRAGVNDVTGQPLQGASTITEQLVKLNEGWTGSRTIATKVKELILAVEVDREYTKDQILTGYLNIAPYGGVDYGVQAAAEDYFRTSAADLTLPQAAMMAAIPQSPTYFSPYGSTQWNPAAGDTFSASALIARQHEVLQQMADQGYITHAQVTAAEQVNVLAEVQPEQAKYTNIQDPYFVLAAKQQLENQFGTSYVNRGGLKVITTLNVSMQNDAEQDVANNAANVASVGGDEEAMVAEDVHTGQVVAMVGGEDFNNPQYGQINYADIRISPGSSLKPFMYAALIQNNTDVGAGSVLYDSQSPIPGYPCTNKAEPTLTSNGGNCLWDDNYVYPGPVTLRYALAGSRNVPAVKASLEVDPTDTSADNYTKSVNDWINLANEAMGVKNAYACYQSGVDVAVAPNSDQTQCYGSAALGTGAVSIDNIANGDTTLANNGQEIPQTFIKQITDASGHAVYQWTQPKATEVYKPDTAYIINSILDDPKATYLPAGQKFQDIDGWDIAVKTGTENQEYNGVMTAWNTQYAVVGFAGYHTLDKQLTPGLFEAITEPITKSWLEQVLGGISGKPVNWTAPTGIKTLAGYVQPYFSDYGAEFPGPTNDLYPSWYAGKGASIPASTIDKVSGYLATTCTPTLAKETVGGGSSSSFSIDIFYPKSYPDMAALEGNTGGTTATSTTQTDNVHNCNDTKPSVTVTPSLNGDNNTVCDGSCSITVAATAGSHPLSGGSYTTAPAGTIAISLNGNTICTINIPPDQSQNFNDSSCVYSPTTTGSGTLTATVVDSVLYSTSDSVTLNYAAPLSGFTATSNGTNSYNFNWSGGGVTYTVTAGSQTCTATAPSTSCTITGLTGSGTATITDTDGDTQETTGY